ncbi:MAG: acyl-CoA dehydrogenase family protein [Beijerinckiaceae bacterium]
MSPFADRASEVAAVAAQYADAVDREARFPHETLRALKAARLMSILIPRELGGDGAELTEAAEICSLIAQNCASSAMMYAMHQIKVSSLISHGGESNWHRSFMEQIAEEQLLLASATTEGGIGGDLRNSICAVEISGDQFKLGKDATVISYGAYADAILTTARRAPDAPSSDQVMVVVMKDQCKLTHTTGWDTLGMRGTCSEGFRLDAEGPAAQILPKPFAEIAAQSMLATSHLLWSAVWFGVANSALSRAQSFVRAEARRRPNMTPPGALRVAEAASMLQLMRSNTLDGLRRFARAQGDGDELTSVGFAVAMNNIKVGASRLAGEIINHAMLVCGILGYKNDTPFSLGRHMRDVLSAPIMISNDRIFGNMSNLLLVHRLDTHLAS